MIVFKQEGNFDKTENFLNRMKKKDYLKILDRYGAAGVNALKSYTPIESGETANSWSYEVENNGNNSKIVFSNSHINKGVNIAIILQYGHGTGTGGYVTGIDYINPAIKPIFDQIAQEAWKEVTA